MKLTDESKAFYSGLYSIVAKVPQGRVTTYGHIAYLLNKPENSRQVGSGLKHFEEIVRQLNVDAETSDYIESIDPDQICWWRIIASSGKISPRGDKGGELLQAKLLRDESVDVAQGLAVDLDGYGWFPDEVDY